MIMVAKGPARILVMSRILTPSRGLGRVSVGAVHSVLGRILMQTGKHKRFYLPNSLPSPFTKSVMSKKEVNLKNSMR